MNERYHYYPCNLVRTMGIGEQKRRWTDMVRSGEPRIKSRQTISDQKKKLANHLSLM